MGRKLKNFQAYIDKIAAYVEACEISIEYSTTMDSDGESVASKRKIKIDPEADESTQVAVFLHEAGHVMDDSLSDKVYVNKLSDAYKAFYKNKATKAQEAMVIECEKRAWVYGRSIARKLRIPLGLWFNEEEIDCLKSYEESE